MSIEISATPHEAANLDFAPAFRLPLSLKQMGDPQNCRHRSGWPHAMTYLRSHHGDSAILLDDFVERSFQHAADRQEWREPWVGIFHHPPHLPDWLDPSAPPSAIIGTAEFKRSLPYLRGAVALSRYLGDWLKRELHCPVLVLKHPTEIPSTQFSMSRFVKDRRLVQVGWYGRNQQGIYQAPAPASYRKLHLLQDRHWVRDAMERTRASSPFKDRPYCGQVETMSELSNDRYDELLGSSVLFAHFFDVSASNTIVEAIARAAPIVVNRHPALVEYLGEDYPLFFDRLDDVENLLCDMRIAAATQYLRALDRSWLCARSFGARVAAFVRQVQPS